MSKPVYHHPLHGDILRTPEERFRALDNWPYSPNYTDRLAGYEGMRVHYIDEGPKDADRVFFCLHGEPTWAYLFRFMIPVFLNSGARVVAPDMFGFGRSDKPVSDDAYSFPFHRTMVMRFIESLSLTGITLVCQDWGGLIGLTLPMDMAGRFERLIVMNTAIATGTAPSPGFDQWRAYVAANPDFSIKSLMKRSTPKMTEAEANAYEAPFPASAYKAGVRQFPQLVMTEPEMEGVDVSRRALDFWSNHWTGDSFMAIGLKDPVLGEAVMRHLATRIRGCPPPLVLADGGHFVQEWGDQVAQAALRHFGDHVGDRAHE